MSYCTMKNYTRNVLKVIVEYDNNKRLLYFSKQNFRDEKVRKNDTDKRKLSTSFPIAFTELQHFDAISRLEILIGEQW